MFTAKWFFALDKALREMGLDADAQSFDEIKENLKNPKRLSPDEFAQNCIYVVLVSGFSQKTAKKVHEKIMSFLKNNGANYNALLKIFNNKNKINAICKLWNNRNSFCYDYYKLKDVNSKISFLQQLPHIGKITANHLARNLGEDVVKYDIWIQRLGVLYAGNSALYNKINNGKLDIKVKNACDKMFADLFLKTGFPKGYIDVVLWKACQSGLIKELL